MLFLGYTSALIRASFKSLYLECKLIKYFLLGTNYLVVVLNTFDDRYDCNFYY
jgi:hypothetical protein